MAYTDSLTVAVYAVTVVGCILSAYVVYKIYSKEGFR